MALSKTALAVVISMTLAAGGAYAQPQVGQINNNTNKTDSHKAFPSETSGVYSIMLKSKGSLDPWYFKQGFDNAAAVAAIESEQQILINDIAALDGNAFLKQRVRLVANMIHVQMSHEAAEKIADHDLITELHQVHGEVLSEAPGNISKYPFLKVNDAGDAVTVALIGNGVDYTHKALGGSGNLNDYTLAWENYGNAWTGFPTDTVIAGFDFSSEKGGLDYNPIEYDKDVTDWLDGNKYLSSRGTRAASIILDKAPDAKLMSFKTYGHKVNGRVYTDHRDYIYPALEMAIDPNLDGKLDDRADILLIDAPGSTAFYKKGDSSSDQTQQNILILRNIAALGTLVVTPAGTWGEYPSYFNVAFRGATPEALTVGSVKLEGEEIQPSSFTPYGYVRGDFQIKPDVVHFGEDIESAIAGTGTESDTTTDALLAAANAVGEAAKVMSQRPELSALEVKALLANTANANGINHEVARIGSGLIDSAASTTSPAFAWEASSYQPNLAYGYKKIINTASYTKAVTIKNLSDETQVYNLSLAVNGDKLGHSALQWYMPESVIVEANQVATFNVTLKVDAAKLPALSIKNSQDYTLENWEKISLNGYIYLSNADQETNRLSLPWAILPINGKAIEKDFTTDTFNTETFSSEWAAKADKGSVEERTMEFVNSSSSEQTFSTFPLIFDVKQKDKNDARNFGHLLQSAGGGVYDVDTNVCESGKKITIATNFFDSIDTPMANHSDKLGHALSVTNIYFPEMLDAINEWYNAGRKSSEIERFADSFPELIAAYTWVEIDVNAQPITWYVDLDMHYDWTKPTARLKKSKLPAVVSPNGKSVISNICLDELYHHDFNSPEQFDTNLLFQFATDRDSRSDAAEDILEYNPVQFGNFIETYYCPPFYISMCNMVPKSEPPWVTTKALTGSLPVLSKVTDETGQVSEQSIDDFSEEITLAPGERGIFGYASHVACNKGSIGYSPNENIHCYPGAMLINTATGYVITTLGYNDTDSAITEPVPGQVFDVYEGVENGHLVGQIAKDSKSFFAVDGDPLSPLSIVLLNALPGDPFAVSEQGEITVLNADALDYENQQTYTLTVQSRQMNDYSSEVDVIINVNNSNDEAPMQIRTINIIEAAQHTEMNTDISASFSDPEGDGIAFTSSNLPEGLTISKSGTISGTPLVAGNFIATIELSDGVNHGSTSVNFAIETSPTTPTEPAVPTTPEAGENSSSGSFGAFLMMLLGLGVISRRRV